MPVPLEDGGKNSKNCRHHTHQTKRVYGPHWACRQSIDVDGNMSDFRVRKKKKPVSQYLVPLFVVECALLAAQRII